MKEILREILVDSLEFSIPPLVEREIELTIIANKATIITGMRRSGKTYLLYNQMRRLMHSGVSKEQLVYLNFEDDRLDSLSGKEMHFIIDIYYEDFPDYTTLKKLIKLKSCRAM